MKKSIPIMGLLLCLLFTGCGKEKKETKTAPTTSTTNSVEAKRTVKTGAFAALQLNIKPILALAGSKANSDPQLLLMQALKADKVFVFLDSNDAGKLMPVIVVPGAAAQMAQLADNALVKPFLQKQGSAYKLDLSKLSPETAKIFAGEELLLKAAGQDLLVSAVSFEAKASKILQSQTATLLQKNAQKDAMFTFMITRGNDAVRLAQAAIDAEAPDSKDRFAKEAVKMLKRFVGSFGQHVSGSDYLALSVKIGADLQNEFHWQQRFFEEKEAQSAASNLQAKTPNHLSFDLSASINTILLKSEAKCTAKQDRNSLVFNATLPQRKFGRLMMGIIFGIGARGETPKPRATADVKVVYSRDALPKLSAVNIKQIEQQLPQILKSSFIARKIRGKELQIMQDTKPEFSNSSVAEMRYTLNRVVDAEGKELPLDTKHWTMKPDRSLLNWISIRFAEENLKPAKAYFSITVKIPAKAEFISFKSGDKPGTVRKGSFCAARLTLLKGDVLSLEARGEQTKIFAIDAQGKPLDTFIPGGNGMVSHDNSNYCGQIAEARIYAFSDFKEIKFDMELDLFNGEGLVMPKTPSTSVRERLAKLEPKPSLMNKENMAKVMATFEPKGERASSWRQLNFSNAPSIGTYAFSYDFELFKAGKSVKKLNQRASTSTSPSTNLYIGKDSDSIKGKITFKVMSQLKSFIIKRKDGASQQFPLPDGKKMIVSFNANQVTVESESKIVWFSFRNAAGRNLKTEGAFFLGSKRNPSKVWGIAEEVELLIPAAWQSKEFNIDSKL